MSNFLSLKDHVYNYISEKINSGELKANEKISEKKIMEDLNISRTPVRESLLRLSNRSMINMIPRVGTYVTQIDIKEVKNAYQVKKKMEAYAAELAAEHASPEQAARLIEIAYEMEKYNGSSDYLKYIAADYEFFKIIRDVCRNEILTGMLEELNDVIVRFLRYIQYVCENPKWHVQSLNSIAMSIRNHDKETAYKETEYFDAVYVKKLFNSYFG